MPPETVNPVPVIEAELTVTCAEPLAVTEIDFDTDVPMAIFPNDSDVGLTLNTGTAALS
jgi:hypothetical protein